MQSKEFEKIGIQGHFGVMQLRHVQKLFSKNAEVMGALLTLVKACGSSISADIGSWS